MGPTPLPSTQGPTTEHATALTSDHYGSDQTMRTTFP
jgi:hypothetical protein